MMSLRMRCLPYRKRWRSFAKRPELTQEGSRVEEAGLRLPECSRANGQSLVPGTVAHFAGSRDNRKCVNIPGAVPRHFRSPSGAAGPALPGPRSQAAGASRPLDGSGRPPRGKPPEGGALASPADRPTGHFCPEN